ncbi:SLC13 family permease [Pseudoluteimonas lycopersici]|uniref:SLC13 family permease n=1 Tax=Pseudoluteimonas lycopersici TaxID=1324796 RepID=A0A516V537_9GAMM|nr:SLC13 family permease [Lysobacter lycopersici]QDQ73618.1 SLC13 family permease [Lysobacter lycopersici]
MDTTLTLTTDMKLVLGLVLLTVVLFMFERLRADLVALVVLVLLGLTGLVAPEDLFNGFSSNAVICVIATMILGAGLDRTGALNRLAGWLLRRARGMEKRLLLLTTTIAGLNSPLMQSPAVMALYLPVASRLSSRTGLPLSRFLLPIAAAIIMGSSLTMVGSSPLILLNDLLVSSNSNLPSGTAVLHPLKMFAPLPVGLALLLLCLAYFHFFGDRLLGNGEEKSAVTPARTQSYFAKSYGIEGDVYELTVGAESPLVGMSLGEAEAKHGAPLLLALKTGSDDSRLAPPADARIWVGSVIGVMGPKQEVADFAQNNFLRMSARLREFGDLFNPSRAGISEAVVPPNSRFIGKTAGELQLRRQQRLSLLAINRDKDVIGEDVRNVKLHAGDMLVLHSIWTDLAAAARSRDFVVVTDYPKAEQRPHKFKIAMTIFAITILVALSSRIPISIALMTGVAGMLVCGVLKIDEAYSAISWRTVFLMACLIPLGWAVDSTGAAAWVAGGMLDKLPDNLPPWVLEAAIAVITSVFAAMIGNVGSTIVMVPLAINLAIASGGNPTAFALVAALSGSNNIVTMSNPVVAMVAGPAGYTTTKLLRVGLPLVLAYIALTVVAVNLLY